MPIRSVIYCIRWNWIVHNVSPLVERRVLLGPPLCWNDMPSRSGRWKKVRRLAWDRDRKTRAPCHICGMPVDYLAEPSSTPDSWEPDHVIPVSKRPDLELDLSNVKASHKRCNRARGDGTNGENAIGMQSRIW